MKDIPNNILDRILNFHVEKRSAAFCLIDKNKHVTSLGGSLITYGLEDLIEGQCVEDRLPFLEGASEADADTVFLPRVALTSGGFADVHIITSKAGIGIVFLDATAETEQIQMMQQKLNETSLQLEEANRKIAQLQKEIDSLK